MLPDSDGVALQGSWWTSKVQFAPENRLCPKRIFHLPTIDNKGLCYFRGGYHAWFKEVGFTLIIKMFESKKGIGLMSRRVKFLDIQALILADQRCAKG